MESVTYFRELNKGSKKNAWDVWDVWDAVIKKAPGVWTGRVITAKMAGWG